MSINNLNEQIDRMKDIMGIREEKADRCLKIARRKYDKPSAYRSGAIVRCRQGKIWKDLKEAGELEDFQLNESDELISMAYNAITRKKGKEYAPDVHELQTWIDDYLENEISNDINEGKKTDYSKEKKSGLHGWFSRRGGEGNKGWVDCNTCRKVDGRKKCKACGRQKGEKRSKYPSCRPTPASCETPGKGKKWGKTKNENNFDLEKNFNLLTEINSDEAYEKFYKNLFDKDNPELDKEMYNKIIQLDPTFIQEKNKLGQYTKWLFRKDNIEKLKKTKDEDLYKIKEDLVFFNRIKNKNLIPQDKRDINKFNLDSLLDFIFELQQQDIDLTSKTDKEKEIKKDVKKYDLKNWTLIIPETEEASCYYGKGTKWCTAAEYNNRYNQYASEGDLYILINKKDPSEKYQFHFESSQFMDAKDREIDLGEFMEDNDDVYAFFSKIKGENLDFEISKSCLERSNVDCFNNFYSNNFTDDQKYQLVRAAFDADENSDSYYTVSETLNNIDYKNMRNDFRRDFLWGLERSMSNSYDDENYDAKMFIDYVGGFTEDNIEDIVKAVNLKDMDEITKLFEIAEDYDAIALLTNYIEDEEIDINFDLINTLENLKSKFNYIHYDKTYESDLVTIKINSYDLEKGLLNITLTPKREGDIRTGNINYKNLITYLTQPKLFESTKKSNNNSKDEIYKVALLFVVVDNKVLFFKRHPDDDSNPGKYGMIGGGIEKGESPQEALKREVKEESGVELTTFKPLKKYRHDNVELNVFYTNEFPVDNIKLDKKEHTSYKFFTLEDVINMSGDEIIETNKGIASDYNKKVNKKYKLEETINRLSDIIHNINENILFEETFMGNHVWNHIKDITPDYNNIPWGFKKRIKNADFNVDTNFDLTSLLKTDGDFKEYYESDDVRYNEDDDLDEIDLYNEIVVVDGELLDGYSRAATLLRRGETKTSAFVGKTKN